MSLLFTPREIGTHLTFNRYFFSATALFGPVSTFPRDVVRTIFFFARPQRQHETLRWLEKLKVFRHAGCISILFYEVRVASVRQLMLFRERLQLEDGQRRALNVKSFFFDIGETEPRDAAEADIMLVLGELKNLATFRASFDTLDPHALRFWSSKAQLFSPRLRVFRLSDLVRVSVGDRRAMEALLMG